MDLDAYSAAHGQDWQRLESLSRARATSGADADELIDRYQAGATALSTITTAAGSSVLGDRLSVTLSRARLRFTGAGANPLRALPAFVLFQLPAALYRLRWITLVVALATVIVAALYAAWALSDPRLLASFADDEELRKLADEDFVNYYSENPAASFTGMVWTNNAWIAAQCVAFGILGVFVPAILMSNAQNLGLTAGVMIQYGHTDTFFLYIAPHGLLELTAIFVAAAAGLRIFWAWIAPGARTRGQALAQDARALFTVALGLVVVLFVSGVIEGFVTPSPWPWPLKIGVGVAALAAFLAYMLILGRSAARAGETGDLGEFESGATQIYAG